MKQITEELGIAGTFKEGFQLFTEIFKTVVPLLIVMTALNAFITFQLIPSVSGINSNTQPGEFWSKFWIYYLTMLVVGIIINIIIIRYVDHKAKDGQHLEFRDLLGLFTPKDFLLILTYIIWMLLLIPAMLALIIPGIYIMLIMIMGIILAVIERNYFWKGIKGAFKLVKKRWWKTFTINLLILVAILVINLVPLYVFSGFSFVNIHTLSVKYIVITSIIGIFAYPVYYSVIIVHYHSLKNNKLNKPQTEEIQVA